MAIVGEAHIIVKAITSGVERDIRNGFQNVEGAGTDAGQRLGKSYGNGFWAGYNSSNGAKVFDRIRDGLRSLDREADSSLRTFQRLATINYFLNGALGVLAGTIGQAVVGLGALAGAAIGAGASLVAAGSAAISAKIGFSTIGFAMKGISQAVSSATAANKAYSDSIKKAKFDAEEAALEIDEAGLNLEKAIEARKRVSDLAPNNRIRREADLNVKKAELALRKAKDAEKNAGKLTGAAGQDPYAGLTPSQRDFAKYLVGIKGKMDELREEVAKGFLPKLKIAIESMLKSTFPTLKQGLKEISNSMGDAAISFANAFDDTQVQADLKQFFTNVSTNVKPLGDILSALAIGVIRFLNAAQPLTEKFLTWVTTVADSFKKWTITNSGSITNFLTLAGDAAALLGDTFKNVFKGLGDIIYENIQPGSGGYAMLEWLKEATSGFAEIGKSEGFSEFFKEAAKGTIALLQVIGKIIGFFIQFAGDKNVTKFWETIRDGFPSMEKVVAAISAALPSIAEFINEIGGIFAVLGETDGLKVFFETLRDIARVAKDVLKALAPFLAFLAPILAVVTAFRLFGKVLKFLGLAGLGLTNKFRNFFNIIKKVFGVFTKGNKDAKRGQKEVGDSVDRTERNVRRMNKAVSATERAFKGMNTAIGRVNTSLTKFKDRIKTALSSLDRLKTSSRNAASQLRGVRTEGDKAASKLSRIKAEGAKAERSLDRVKNSARKARAELKLLGSTNSSPTIGSRGGTVGSARGGARPVAPVGGIGLGAAAGVAVGAVVLGSLVAQGDQAQKTAKQTEFLVRTNSGLGTASKTAADRINKLAENLSISTGVSKGNIIAAQQLFLKYGPLAKEVGNAGGAFDKATQLATDLSVALGTDAAGAADILITALRNNETAIADLEAQGITFTDEEKKKYDALLKTVDPLDDQNYLLDLLKGKYSGMATEYVTATDKIARRVDLFIESMAKGMKELAESFAEPVELILSTFDAVTTKDPKVRKKVDADWFEFIKKNFSFAIPRFSDGGYIGTSSGGMVSGPGTSRSDSVSAMLSNGEFVVNARATAQNRGLLEAINSNKAAPASSNIYLTVNPSAGMDEKALANEVSRQLAFQIRRGGM